MGGWPATQVRPSPIQHESITAASRLRNHQLPLVNNSQSES